MFRDGIFDNFGEFLDRINESVPRVDKEEIQENVCKEEKGDIVENQISIGDTVRIKDKEGNTTVVPSAKVHDLSTTEPEGSLAIEITGSEDEDQRQWYDEADYEITLLKKSSESVTQEQIFRAQYYDPETKESNYIRFPAENMESAWEVARNKKHNCTIVNVKAVEESTSRVYEEVWNLESEEEELASEELSMIAEEAINGEIGRQKYLERLWGERWDSIKDKLETEGSVWYVWWMDGVHEHMKERTSMEESTLHEQERKEAEQTEQPTEETPRDDAERLSMEDWSDTDKDGVPKRVDKVERPTELHQVKDEDLSQEVTYERKTDPLYLCNECFKTFRADSPVCKCGSKVVERIGKVKEAYQEQHPGKYTVTFYDGHKETVDYAESQKDAAAKARDVYKKEDRILGVELEKKADPKGIGEKFTVIFIDGHREVVEAPNKFTAMNKAREIYKKEHRINQVNPGVMERVNEPLQRTKEGKEELTAPKVRISTGQGTSYYADCPNCNTTNWLSGELTTDKVVCKKCGTPFGLGDEVEHEEYIRREVPESKVNEGNWWQELIDQIQKDTKFKKLMSKYGVKSKEVLDYFGRKYWSQTADENATKAALENVINDLNLEESKLQEQDDVEALRKRRMDIEQKMLDAEKRYQEEQNRMGASVYDLNQKIKELEKTESKLQEGLFKVGNIVSPRPDSNLDVWGRGKVEEVDPDKGIFVHWEKGNQTFWVDPREIYICESKLQEQDENGYSTIAKGMDKEEAVKLARDKKGQMIADEEDPSKFAVIVKKE